MHGTQGEKLSHLSIHLRGQPIEGGELQMTSSTVPLGSASNPDEYSGRVTALQGTNIHARVTNGSGSGLTLIARLQLDPGAGTASGTGQGMA